MYAVARLNSFDPNKLAASSDALARFDQVHRAQRGYAGPVVVDLHAGADAWYSTFGTARRTARQPCRSSGPTSGGS